MNATKHFNSEENGTQAQDFLGGQLLIAMPNMADPRFKRSVLLICAHDEEHAMGIVVNKPLGKIEMGILYTQLDIDPREDVNSESAFFGGPIQTDRGVVLHTLDYELPTTLHVAPNLGVTATRDILIDIGGRKPNRPKPRRYILAIGHSGWEGGQLEQEIAMNAWVHCPSDEAIIFEGDNESTWRRALSCLGVTSAMLSPEWSTIRSEDAPLN